MKVNSISGFSGTDHHNGNAVVLILLLMLQASQKPIGKPADKDEADQQEHIQEIIAGRNRLLSLYPEELDADAVTDRRKHTGDHQVLELCFSGKYPHAGVHPEQIQDQDRNQYIQWQEPVDRCQEMSWDLCQFKIITDQDCQIAAGDDTDDIVDQQKRSSI